MDDRTREALDVLERRREMLERLRSPADKRELVRELECSRATVDRAIRRLEGMEWIDRVDGGWQLTHAGRTILDRYLRFIDAFGDVLAGTEALPSLPPDAGVAPAMLEGARVETGPESGGDAGGLPTPLRRRIETADRIRLAAPDETAATLLSSCRELSSGPVEAVVEPDALDRLPDRTPELARWLAAADRASAFAAETHPYALVLVEDGETTWVSVVSHRVDGTVEGVVSNDRESAVEWAVERYRAIRRVATPLSDAVEWGGVAARRDRDPAQQLAREGFRELTPAYFAEREPLPLPTSWRAGVDFPEVAAGHALEREHVRDGERRSLVEDLLDALDGGGMRALIGPPGSGKSTVCRDVAHRWYRSIGPVLYRASDRGEPFESWRSLLELLEGRTRPTLVVVEDALQADARSVFRAMEALEGAADVAFLLEARTDRWEVDATFDVDPRDEAVRERIETVRMPALDATERRRFRERLEGATDVSLDGDVATGAASRDANGRDGDAHPAELLLFLHRLTLQAEPLEGTDAGGKTELADDVGELSASLRGDELALDVAVLVNVLNAAGLPVVREYAYALALEAGDGIVVPGTGEAGTTGPPEDAVADRVGRVDRAFDRLEGQVLFDAGNRDGYRTVHAGWSTAFLAHLLETDGRAAIDRVGRCASTLLALADDERARRRIRELRDDRSVEPFGSNLDPLDRISEDPAGWAESVSRRLVEFGIAHPALAPLFCGREGPAFAVPHSRTTGRRIELTERCGRAHLAGGRLDDAKRAFESALDRIDGVQLPPEERTRQRARCRVGLAQVAAERGEYDAAESLYEQAREAYRALEDRLGVADSLRHLGSVSQLRANLDEAETRYAESLDVYWELGAERKLTAALNDLGSVAQDRGDFETARRHYRESLRRYVALGARRELVDVLTNLATVGWVSGDLVDAEKHARRAAATARDIGYEPGLAIAQYHLAVVANVRGDAETARDRAARAAERFEAIGNDHHEASARSLLGEIERASGNLDRAAEHYEVAAARHERLEDDRALLDALTGLGRVARERGDLERAAGHGRRALGLAREVGDARSEAACLRLLGGIDRERGELDRAEERLQAALSGYREVEDAHGEASALLELGEVAAERGAQARARERFDRAIEEYRETGAVADAADALDRLAERCEAWGDASEARRRRATAERLREGTSTLN